MESQILLTLLLSDCLNVACDAFHARLACGDPALQQQLKRRDDLALDYAQLIEEEIAARKLNAA